MKIRWTKNKGSLAGSYAVMWWLDSGFGNAMDYPGAWNPGAGLWGWVNGERKTPPKMDDVLNWKGKK